VCQPSKQSKQRGRNGPSGYDFEGGVGLGPRGRIKVSGWWLSVACKAADGGKTRKSNPAVS